MKVVHLPDNGKNFISYEIVKNNIDFDDGELMFNLSKKERDYEVTIDICMDYTGGLVCGTADGLKYVAQVVIPPIEYTEEIGEPDEEGNETTARVPVPFDIEQCELRLWEMEA